jgi:hypothetical protein
MTISTGDTGDTGDNPIKTGIYAVAGANFRPATPATSQ